MAGEMGNATDLNFVEFLTARGQNDDADKILECIPCIEGKN